MKYCLLYFFTILTLLTCISCAIVYSTDISRSHKVTTKGNEDTNSNRAVDSDLYSSAVNKSNRPKNRVKRYIMKKGKCADGFVWYAIKCIPCDEYVEITGDSC